MIHHLRATLRLTGQVVGGFSMYDERSTPDECDSRTTHLNHMIEERSSSICFSTCRQVEPAQQDNTTEGDNDLIHNEKACAETLLYAKRANENV